MWEAMWHKAPISSVAVSSSGYIASAGYDNQVVLWRDLDRNSLSRGWHDHLVNQCEFSPNGDLLVTASSDYSARIWSVPDMRLRSILVGHSDDVMKAGFNLSGTLVATGSYDSTLKVWDLAGNCLSTLKGHAGLIEAISWSGDDLLYSCGTDRTIRRWNVGKSECEKVIETGDCDLDALVVRDSGAFLAGNDTGQIIAFDAEGIETNTFDAHQSGVKRLVLSKDRSSLLSLGYDQMAVLWSVQPNGFLKKMRETEYPDIVWARSADFYSDDHIVFSTFGSCFAILDLVNDTWDVSGIRPSVSLNAVCVDSTGYVNAIGDSGELQKDSEIIGGPKTLCNFLSVCGPRILTGGQTGRVYDAVTGKSLFHHNAPLNCGISLARDESWICAVGSYSGELILLRVNSEGSTDVIELKSVMNNAIKGISASSDGATLFAGSADGELVVLCGKTFERLASLENAHNGILNDCCTHHRGFATVSRDMTMKLWTNRLDAPVVVESRHPNSIKCISSNLAGTILASGSYGGTVELYDLTKNCFIGDLIRPTAAGISNIAWVESRNEFVAASYDGNLYSVGI